MSVQISYTCDQCAKSVAEPVKANLQRPDPTYEPPVRDRSKLTVQDWYKLTPSEGFAPEPDESPVIPTQFLNLHFCDMLCLSAWVADDIGADLA